jgi:hypothetical protein
VQFLFSGSVLAKGALTRGGGTPLWLVDDCDGGARVVDSV